MIAADVEQLASSFVTNCKLEQKNKLLTLDGTWPSLGTVDLLVYSLRDKEARTSEDERIFEEATAYLGRVIHRYWELCYEEVILEKAEEGIRLLAKGGEFLEEDQQLVLNLQKELSHIFYEPPTQIPVFSMFFRPVTRDYNIISLLMIGIVLGQSPLIQGRILDRNTELLDKGMDKVIKKIAKDCSNFYRRNFPEETLGQLPELYLNDLIFPPTLMRESYPLLSAIDKFKEFISEYQLPRSKIVELGRNLAKVPDERISLFGYVLYSALQNQSLHTDMIATGETLGSQTFFLRPAMISLREKFFSCADWVDEKEFSPLVENRIREESLLGYLPWLELDFEEIRSNFAKPIFRKFLYQMCLYDLQECLYLWEKFIDLEEQNINFRVQQIKLLIASKDHIKASYILRGVLTEPEIKDEAIIDNLNGLLSSLSGDTQEAQKFFSSAYKNVDKYHHKFVEISINYSWVLILNGSLEEAKEVLKNVPFSNHGFPMTLATNLYITNLLEAKRTSANLAELELMKEFILRLNFRDRFAFGLIENSEIFLSGNFLKEPPLTK